MNDLDRINRGAKFYPTKMPDELPAIQLADGPMVFAYVKEIDGLPTLCVTVDTVERGSYPEGSPLNGMLGVVPVRVNINEETVFTGRVGIGSEDE